MQTNEKAKQQAGSAVAKKPTSTTEARAEYGRKCEVYTKTVERCGADIDAARRSLDALESKASREMEQAKTAMLDARDVLISFESADAEAKKAG